MSIVLRLTVVLALLLGTSAQAAVFGPARDYPTGGNGGPGWHETNATTADFNRDGRPDLVTADLFNFFTATPGPLLQLGQAGGALQSPGTRVMTGAGYGGYEVGDVGAGDLNADGKPDLVVTNSYQLHSLLGRGDGTFAAPVSYSVAQGGQEDLQLADVNRDGKLDAIVLLRYGVKTFFGDGTGRFPTSKTATFGTFAMSGIEVADFDRDGKPDLAATDAGQEKILALRGDGAGGFTQFAAVTTTFVPGTVLAGDFDEDGYDDIVATNEADGGKDNVTVALNTGGGGFGTPTYHDGGFGPVSGAVGDLNRDGHADLVSSDTVTSQELVLLGDGHGGFSDGGAYAVSGAPQSPVLDDFDRDGRLDLAVGGVAHSGSSYGASLASVLLGAS